MNLYLDTSAFIKHYIFEHGSTEIDGIIKRADILGTTMLTYAEMSATFAKVVRMGLHDRASVLSRMEVFYRDWQRIARVSVNDKVLSLAGELAWKHDLRGYDAIHLASAWQWQMIMESPIIFASFDKRLWQAADVVGLQPFPADLPSFLR